MLNVQKSHLDPHQCGEWLGFSIDLETGKFYVPENKLGKLKLAISQINVHTWVPVRSLASIVGKIISMSLAIGSISRLRTRALFSAINSRRSWCDSILLPHNAKEELDFWYRNVDSLNGGPIWFEPGATRIVYSDASDSGYGGSLVELGPDIAQGQWSEVEASQLHLAGV